MSTILILGGTSAVAMAYARNAALSGNNLHLVGRDEITLCANALDLQARGAGSVDVTVLDLGIPANVEANWTKILETSPGIERILLAYGVLGEQCQTQDSLDILTRNMNINFNSVVLWCELAFRHFRTVGTGQITVIGSVAGDRGRQSNYHYGAAKAALDIFVSGMAHRAAKTVEADIDVLLVKPGFIDTPMTDGMDKSGFLWTSPEKVAAIIRKAERTRRTKIYAPWFWRYVMLIICNVPFFIFRRTSL